MSLVHRASNGLLLIIPRLPTQPWRSGVSNQLLLFNQLPPCLIKLSNTTMRLVAHLRHLEAFLHR